MNENITEDSYAKQPSSEEPSGDGEKSGSDSTLWSEAPWLWLKGFLMGSADVVPGVSGGTMALITGIYGRLIYAVKSADMRLVRSLVTLRLSDLFQNFHWKFLFLLLTGIISAVLFFTNVVPLQVYMHTDPEIVYGLFFGLIAGSIFVLLKEVDHRDRSLSNGTALVAGTLIGYWVVTLVPTDTPDSFLFVFLSGMIAFCAMILPGISGSYLLLILGKYDYVLGQFAVIDTEFATAAAALAPLFLGGATGIILFSRLLSWFLDNFHAVTMMVLIGFLIGSLTVIWPWQERQYETFTESVELADPDAPIVHQLRENPPDGRAPDYQILGERVTVEVNGEAAERIEVITLSRKLIRSEPFFPVGPMSTSDPSSPEGSGNKLFQGLLGMAAGLLLVWGVDLLRKKGSPAII